MKKTILIAGLLAGFTAFAADKGAELFQKAVTQEQAAGNLDEAIKLYQRVAKEFASDRPLAAKALVREAQCYEKLGQDKAVKVYEQVARDYRDQAEPVATANARLAALRPKEIMAAKPRPVEIKGAGYFETDGNRAMYLDDETHAIVVGDLARRDKKIVYQLKAGEQLATFRPFAPSRDFSKVAMMLIRPGVGDVEAVANADGTGFREIRGEYACFPNWSWDGRYLFVCENQKVLRVTAASGEAVDVPTGKYWRNPHVSPDGRFIALYDQPATGAGSVLVMPSRGGEPQIVAENARIVDWTRDGRWLVVIAGNALLAIPMRDGVRAGDPVSMGSTDSQIGRTYANGALNLLSLSPEGSKVTWLGTLGPDGHYGDWKRLRLSGDGGNQWQLVTWSPDSSRIAYVGRYGEPSKGTGMITSTVRVRDLRTGEERELHQFENLATHCQWAAHQPDLFCESIVSNRRAGKTADLVSISVETGAVKQLGDLQGFDGRPLDVRSDSGLYLIGRRSIVRWDIGSGQQTTVDERPDEGTGAWWRFVSPDLRWAARMTDKGSAEFRPMQGGDWKPLLKQGSTTGFFAYSPDGNWLLYPGIDAHGKSSLFRVPASGGEPEQIADCPGPAINVYLSVSPDGKKIIAQPPNPQPYAVSVLENFEPK